MHTIIELQITENFTTTIEMRGSLDSGQCIVFSHGFGVGRDSRGMFTNLVEQLSEDYLCVQFEYTTWKGKENWIDSFKIMQQTLKRVIEYLDRKYQIHDKHIVAHSLGCLLASVCSNDFHKQIYLAPTVEPIAERLQTYFSNKPGSVVDESGTISATRTDGSTTHITHSFFEEIKPIIPWDVYATSRKTVLVVEAAQDELITNHTEAWRVLGNFEVISIPGDHNFTASNRPLLVQTVLDYLRDV